MINLACKYHHNLNDIYHQLNAIIIILVFALVFAFFMSMIKDLTKI